MTRPSEPLVSRLRQILEARAGSEAEVALRAGMSVERLHLILSDDGDMTVDELILLSQALALQPEDLGLDLEDEEDDAVPFEPNVTSLPFARGATSGDEDDSEDADANELPYDSPFDADTPYDAPSGTLDLDSEEIYLDDALDPEGNQVRQLFEVGFGLGCTFFFQAKTALLQESGVPRAVLERYADRELPIQLDAAYHAYNEPEYTTHGVTLKLSFDAIYTCTFPWAAITRLAFFPEPPPEPEPEPEEEEEPPSGGRPPFLRLVE